MSKLAKLFKEKNLTNHQKEQFEMIEVTLILLGYKFENMSNAVYVILQHTIIAIYKNPKNIYDVFVQYPPNNQHDHYLKNVKLEEIIDILSTLK
ncbi:hypothetical protein D3C87_81040 [compost metagenome]